MGHLLLTSLLCVVVTLSRVTAQTCPATDCYFTDVATLNPTMTEPNRYFVIGGLFDVHTPGDNPVTCGNGMSPEGIVSQLAFFWAINKYRINIVTRGVSVGAVAYDNCMRPERTIENVLGFAQCKINIRSMQKENLVAYVGPYTSEDLSSVAKVATEIKVTLVSPTADAVDLNVQGLNVLQLSPSFTAEISAMLGFLDEVNSDFVVVLYSEMDPFWNSARMDLMNKLESRSRKICATYSANIDNISDLPLFVENELRSVRSQKYIIPLMPLNKLNDLLKAIAANPNVNGEFRFILSSQIGVDLAFLTSSGNAARDAIVVSLATPPSAPLYSSLANDLAEFKAYAAGLNNGTSANIIDLDNAWTSSYITMYNALPAIGDRETLENAATRTLFAVKIIMDGMEAALQDCSASSSNYQFCDTYRNVNFNDNLRYNLFIRAFGGVSPAPNQLPRSRYYYTYRHFENQQGSDARLNKVGEFSYVNGQWVPSVVSNITNSGNFGPSTCNGVEECCRQLSTAAPTTTTPASQTTRGPVATTPKDYTEVRYRKGQAITGAYPSNYMEDNRVTWGTRFDQGHRWIIALGVLAGLGILSVLIFEIYILYKLLGTRMGQKWRTMWLGQLLLFGILLAYLVLFAYIFVPTKATCGITRFGVGVSYAICFAVLLVKLMVILTSKSSDVFLPGDESPNYLKGIYQFLMFIFAVGVQIVIDVQWLITVPPEAVEVTSNIGQKVWVCNHYTWDADNGMEDMKTMVRTNFENHVMSLIYIMVMILICTVLSLNAHGIITNHRESVFIGIAAGFSIPLWLAWTLVGGLNADHDYAEEFGDACIAFGLFLTVTLILFAMFLPKVRQLVNMGVEGIYLEDDRDTYYAGSVIMAPPSYKSKGPGSVIYVNNQGIYSEPVVISNGDPSKEDATHLKHPGSTYSAPPTYLKRPESAYGGSRVLRVTDDLKGRHPQKRPQSEVAYGTAGRPRSMKGTLTRSRSQDLGAL